MSETKDVGDIGVNVNDIVLVDSFADINVNAGEAATLGAATKSIKFRQSCSKPRNYISRLIFEMEMSLIQLNATSLTISKLEEMSIFIYEAMNISARNYHSVQHVFDLINHDERLEDDHIAILAACFHDCIYYNVDGGLTPVQALLLKGSFKVMGPKIEDQDDSDYINAYQIYKFFATDSQKAIDNESNDTKLLQMVEGIFGYTPGQNIKLAGDGLNEFLSAVVAVRMLEDHLPIEILAQIACCIEATIPFRNIDQNGMSHMDHLCDNMKEAKIVYNLELSDDDVVKSIQRACLLSNCDVENFGTTDRHYFLDMAWSLLSEANVSLRNEYVYSVDHYREALYKTYGFYGFLQPAVVFHEFQGVPALSEMDRLRQECSNNLKFGRTYFGAKIVAMSLVSALAVLTGGDAPISLFTGDLRALLRRSSAARDISGKRNEGNFELAGLQNNKAFDLFDNSNHTPDECLKSRNEYVYTILENGRRSKTSFDTKRSPWAALLYGHLGDEGLTRILNDLSKHPMTEEGAWSLLRALPRTPVKIIFRSIFEQAMSRRDKICEIFSKL